MLDKVLKGLVLAAAVAGFVMPWTLARGEQEARYPMPDSRDFSFGFWQNGWRKGPSDPSPDILAIETGYYGFQIDMDNLNRPRLGLLGDESDYRSALQAGTRRLKDLPEASLELALEVDGRVYRATACKSGVNTGVDRLKNTLMWESGRYHQHYELQGLVFRDEAGQVLSCNGDLELYGWPGNLTLVTELMPEFVFADGPAEGLSGPGLCIIDKPLDIPHKPELEPTNLTVECWVYFPEVMERRDGWLLCKNWNEWEDGNYGFMLTAEGKHLIAYMNIGGGKDSVIRIEQSGDLSKGKWHHLAMTYDSKVMSLYIDGHRHAEKTVGLPRSPGSGLLRLGRRADGSLGVASAVYDEVRIWSRALSHAEIKAHAERPRQMDSREGLAFSLTFDELEPPGEPVWSNATVRMALKSRELEWKTDHKVPGPWRRGTRHRVSLTCSMPGAETPPTNVAVRVSTPDGQVFPVSFDQESNCRRVDIVKMKRSWPWLPQADGGSGNHYDEFLVEVENPGSAASRIPFQLYMDNPPGVTGLVPLLCEEDGTPTGIPVQISKNWHMGAYLHTYTFLPAIPGKKVYRLRIPYSYYGSIPSASHAQLSLVGWGGNGRWDQLAIGSWGETFCFDMDMTCTDVAITDVRCLFIRNGKSGEEWNWSDGGWGGDWLGLFNAKGEKLAFRDLKTAYLAHGPCLTDVRHHGAYGSGREVDLEATVHTLRTDDYARTFNRLRYIFNQETPVRDAFFFKVGGGWYTTPKVAYGNRDGLLAEQEVPQTMKAGESLKEPFLLEGKGPWWVAYPGAFTGDDRDWGTGSRALIIREYRASFGGKVFESPSIALPVNTRTVLRDRTDINLLLVPPAGVTNFMPGDVVEMDVEWITLPREADDYYGPNEAFRKHLQENPRSWKTVHREAIGNDLVLEVEGGKVQHRYPIIISVEKPEVKVKVTGGVGYVPIRFDGLAAIGYSLYEVTAEGEKKLDQSRHGNDFWQTDYDAAGKTYRLSFNLPLDGKATSTWVLKKH